MEQLSLQIFLDGQWRDAATLTTHDVANGHHGDCAFTYAVDYAIDNDAKPEAVVSCRYPVSLEFYQQTGWPAFLLDIIPSGAGRSHWLKQLQIADGDAADWALLAQGAGNPPGNLRVADAIERRAALRVPMADGSLVANTKHPGFTRDDILMRQEYFIEYAAQNGAHVAGGSDVQGVAPKFLLQQDDVGNWHAEGALPDARVHANWIVKFPRGKTDADRKVLRNEAAYMAVAATLGLKTHPEKTIWENNALFVPRFDRRVTHEGLQRYGMESLYSLAGVCEYGARTSLNTLVYGLATHATNPRAEVVEFLRRDIVNVLLGNKDNHGRNTAVLRDRLGAVTLSPVFDLAPMYLDPEAIPRVCRWEGDAEVAGTPIWGRVAESLPAINDARAMRELVARWADDFERLAEVMAAANVDDDIIEFRMIGLKDQLKTLRDAKPRIMVMQTERGLEP